MDERDRRSYEEYRTEWNITDDMIGSEPISCSENTMPDIIISAASPFALGTSALNIAV